MKLDEATAALVPDAAIDQQLNPEEAAKLIRRIEREIPKRRGAASVRRTVMRGMRENPAQSLDGRAPRR